MDILKINIKVLAKDKKFNDETRQYDIVADIDPQVLQKMAQVLKGYFLQVMRVMSPKVFSDCQTNLKPNAGDIGDKDLLIYVVTGTLISEWPREHPAAGGATALFTTGEVLSEAYWPTAKSRGGSAAEIGNVLANIAMHEFGHNKFTSKPGANLHTDGGDGIFQAVQNVAQLKTASLNEKNIKSMAGVLGNVVKQATSFIT